ncbi:aldo/keto reductase [Amycolatopsis japonica]|uniref:aldo/keto reductase n=1 Tax=Amycolatopsis japonica TaxID=208439 RepID=UPI0033FD0370
MFREYLDAGGNFVDTADFYTAGESETIPVGGRIPHRRVPADRPARRRPAKAG